jgi:hypothetical protein
MKNAIRIAVAGTALLGSATAALATPAPNPSGGAADLWLFVSDSAAGVTYARDLGSANAMTAIMPSASLKPTTGGPVVLDTSITATINVAADSALTTFITNANTAHQALTWTVEGINEAGNLLRPGKVLGITANGGNPTVTSLLNTGNLAGWASGFQGDVTNIYGPGGAQQGGPGQSFTIATGSPPANAWGAGPGGIGGSVDLYGQGLDATNAIGSTSQLYGLTGNGVNGGQLQSYVLGTIELTTGGLLEMVSNNTVPLPAAVWLLGSGLLGLAGVGRRRPAPAKA